MAITPAVNQLAFPHRVLSMPGLQNTRNFSDPPCAPQRSPTELSAATKRHKLLCQQFLSKGFQNTIDFHAQQRLRTHKFPQYKNSLTAIFFSNKSKLSFNLPGFPELNCISHSLWTRQDKHLLILITDLQTVTRTYLNIKGGGKNPKLQTLLRLVIPQKHPTAFLSQDKLKNTVIQQWFAGFQGVQWTCWSQVTHTWTTAQVWGSSQLASRS